MKAKSCLITLVFTLAVATLSAHAADSAAAPSAAVIPFSEIGAKATADYKGDAIGIHSTADGAMLHTGFQKLEAEATREGLWIISTEDGGGRFRLRADRVGRASSDSQLPQLGSVSLAEKTVAFVLPSLTEEYSVSMDGVRQDFIVAQRPEGTGGLRVGLGLTGARAEAAAFGVKLTVDGSGRELAYSRLHVTDAKGQDLTATMEVTGASGITVCVDDAAAVYPIRIDPTFSDADWVALAPSSVIPGANGIVRAIALQGTDIYAGGDFTFIGNVAANRVAKWNGSAWTPLGTATQNGTAGTVNAIAAVSATEVYVGGTFITVADSTGVGISANRIAKWNGSTNTWSRLGTATQNGTGSTVRAIAALSATEVYVGGDFTTVADSNSASITANSIAKWNGTAWSPLGSATQNGVTSAASFVNAIAPRSATEIYVGGHFTTVGDSTSATISANRVARWDSTTSTWSPLGTPTQNGTNGDVAAIAALSSTEVYVGGSFTTVADSTGATISAKGIARWNNTASSWSPLGTPTQNGIVINSVSTISALSSTEIYVGGNFPSVADSTSVNIGATSIAKWNGVTNTWSRLGSSTQQGVSLTTDPGNSLTVSAILAVSSSSVFVGGNFLGASDSTKAGLAVGRIAQWNGSTNTWAQIPTATGGASSVVRAVAVRGTDLYVGGSFTSIGAVAANRIAKWNGSVWSPLGTATQNGVTTALSQVNAIAALSATEIYVGGSFTTVADSTNASITANRIAKWDSTASTWSRLGTATQNGLTTPQTQVNAIAALSATEIYVGGSFTTAADSSTASITANRIAKWTGSAWSRLGTATQNGVTSSSFVNAIAALSATEIYVGGTFTTVADSTAATIAANHIARWNSSTSTWSPLGTATQNGTGGSFNTVNAIAALSSTEVYVGGIFTSVADSTSASITANRIAKWNGNANTWSRLGTATQNGTTTNGTSGGVNAIAVVSPAEIYVGGNFTTVADSSSASKPANRLVKWDGSAWTAMGGGVDATVRALAVDGTIHLFIGGDFTTEGTSPVMISPFIAQANLPTTPPDIIVEQPAGTNLVTGTASIAFAATDMGTSSAAKTFSIKNAGNIILTLTAPAVTGGNAGDFSVDNTGIVLSLSGIVQTTFAVTFTPTAAGSRTTTLRIVSNDPDESPFDITLTGTGNAPDIAVEQPAGTGIADTGTKSFGSTVLGSTVNLTFTLKNPSPGPGTLTGLGITKDGTNAADFSVTANPTAPVATGTSTTFAVQFAPTTGASGLRNAAIHIANNVAGAKNPYDINLTGLAYSFTTDTDSDGLNDASEFQMAALGFDPAVAQPALVAALFNNASGAGLFTAAQIQTINPSMGFIQANPTTGNSRSN